MGVGGGGGGGGGGAQVTNLPGWRVSLASSGLVGISLAVARFGKGPFF